MEMEEFHEAAEKLLVEHGPTWTKESEAEKAKLRELLQRETTKVSEREDELAKKMQLLENVEQKLLRAEQDRLTLENQVEQFGNANKLQVSSL